MGRQHYSSQSVDFKTCIIYEWKSFVCFKENKHINKKHRLTWHLIINSKILKNYVLMLKWKGCLSTAYCERNVEKVNLTQNTCQLPFPMSCFTVIPILKILLKSYATAPFTIQFMH